MSQWSNIYRDVLKNGWKICVLDRHGSFTIATYEPDWSIEFWEQNTWTQSAVVREALEQGCLNLYSLEPNDD